MVEVKTACVNTENENEQFSKMMAEIIKDNP